MHVKTQINLKNKCFTLPNCYENGPLYFIKPNFEVSKMKTLESWIKSLMQNSYIFLYDGLFVKKNLFMLKGYFIDVRCLYHFKSHKHHEERILLSKHQEHICPNIWVSSEPALTLSSLLMAAFSSKC